MHDRAFTTSMPKPEIIVLIPESTRKARGGSADSPEVDSIAASLPATARAKLEGLREEVSTRARKDRSAPAASFLRIVGSKVTCT